MSWWAFLQGASTGGGALRRQPPAAEMLDEVDERDAEPALTSHTALRSSGTDPNG
jgi:hypothetical protein